MKLVTVEAFIAADAIDRARQAIEDLADIVRAMPGCSGYALYSSDAAIAIVQKWATLEQFDAYRTSDTFASLGAALKPLMTAPPVTTIASVDTL